MSTAIEWTDVTWNPIVGCSRVSAGCEHCYAERVAHRGMSAQHRGLTVMGRHGPRWNGSVRFLEEKLDEPMRWRKPRRVFVNSMSDLFHPGVSDGEVAAIFATMAACPQHVFQVLTKRPERMRDFARRVATSQPHDEINARVFDLTNALNGGFATWPLANVWLGVSVEDQSAADERIPFLLETPAAVRWVSYEPALGPVSFGRWLPCSIRCGRDAAHTGGPPKLGPWLDWVVIGGESGPGARPFDLAWARSTIEACRAAGVPCFVKQLGPRPHSEHSIEAPRHNDGMAVVGGRVGGRYLHVLWSHDRKGGDMNEWPEDLRVREWPEARRS